MNNSNLYASLFIFFLSLFIHESISVLFALLIFLSIFANHYLAYPTIPFFKSILTTKTTRHHLFGVVSVIGLYFLLYLVWRWIYPSGYSGNSFGDMNFNRIFPTLISLSTNGSLISDLFLPYAVRFGDPVMNDGYTVTYSLLSYIGNVADNPSSLLFSVIVFLVLFLVLVKPINQSKLKLYNRKITILSGITIGSIITFVPILPVALSAKYQQQFFDSGVHAYVYTGLSHFGVTLVIASLIFWIRLLNFSSKIYTYTVSLTFSSLIAVLAYGGYQMNDAIANDIRIETSRWKAIDKASELSSYLSSSIDTIYAPRLSSGTWFTGLGMDYWKAYTVERYGKVFTYNNTSIPINKINKDKVAYMDFILPHGENNLIVLIANIGISDTYGSVISDKIIVSIKELSPSDRVKYILSYHDLKGGLVSVRLAQLKSLNNEGTLRIISDIKAIPETIRIDHHSIVNSINIDCNKSGDVGTTLAIGTSIYGGQPACIADTFMTKKEYELIDWPIIEEYLGKPISKFTKGSWELVDYPFNIVGKMPRVNNNLIKSHKYLLLPNGFHQIGQLVKKDGKNWREALKGEVGYLSYGPYMNLAPGKYEVLFDIKTDNIDDSTNILGTVDIASGGVSLVAKNITIENSKHTITLPLEVTENSGTYEFRIFSRGTSNLRFKDIMIRKIILFEKLFT